MPIPEDVVRCRLVFDLVRSGQPIDQAVMGFHVQRVHVPANPTDWPADTSAIAERVRSAWQSKVVPASMWPSAVRLSRVETYHLDAQTGLTLDKGVAVGDPQAPWTGSGTGSPLPPEASMAVSLYGYDPANFDPLAKYKRGRFFLPPFQINAMGGGADAWAYDNTQFDNTRGVITAFLNEVDGSALGFGAPLPGSDSIRLGVLSRTRGIFSPVTHFRFGKAPDTQRRRGSNIPENYLTVARTP